MIRHSFFHRRGEIYMKHVLGNKKAIMLFVVPALVLYSIIVMLPVLWSFYYSFFNGSPGLKWEFCGADNYLRLLRDKNFLNALSVNGRYILVTVIGQVGLGLLLSLMFRFWLRRAHEGLPILGTAAWIHMICMLAVMAGSVWFFGFRKEKAEGPREDAKEEKKEP